MLTCYVMLFRFLGRFIEVVGRVLGNAMHRNELRMIVTGRETQIETSLPHHHLIVEIFLLALITKIFQSFAVGGTVVRAWIDESGDFDFFRFLRIQLLGGEVTHPAEEDLLVFWSFVQDSELRHLLGWT